MHSFILFLINGFFLGFFTIISQYLIDYAISGIFYYHYLIASLLTITPFMFVNFMLQRKIIFKKGGSIIKFFCSSILIMILISLLAEVFNTYTLFNLNIMKINLNLNFIFSAIFIAPLSFFMKKNIVFKT
jgi:hypothetical protein